MIEVRLNCRVHLPLRVFMVRAKARHAAARPSGEAEFWADKFVMESGRENGHHRRSEQGVDPVYGEKNRVPRKIRYIFN